MVRHYKAVTDHTPIDFEDGLEAIESYFEGRSEEIRSIFGHWKHRPPEPDDVEALIDLTTRRLIEFALVCDAIPMRTPLKLEATVKAMAKRPAEFLANVRYYHPEAVALVYDAFTRESKENRVLLSHFEAGSGPPPPAEAIAQAAFKVWDDLIEQT